MKVSQSVLRLLNLFVAIRELSPFDRLDGDEELLLNDLVLRWSKQDKVMVRDLLSDNRYPSSATAYRRLMRLHEKGLVLFQVPNEDKRLRYTRSSLLPDWTSTNSAITSSPSVRNRSIREC